VPEAGWLRLLLEHYEDPDVWGVGGAATPRWPGDGERPDLLPAPFSLGRGELDWVVGCTYRGQPDAAADVRNLMGCNMSFRRSVFADVGGFSDDLGRVGKTPLGCEETEFCIRVQQADPSRRVVFEPAAMVRHRVTPERVRWRYLLSRCYSEGLSKAALAGMVTSSAALASERSYVSRVLPGGLARELGRALRGRRSGLVGAAAVVTGLGWTVGGYVRGRLARRQPASPLHRFDSAAA